MMEVVQPVASRTAAARITDGLLQIAENAVTALAATWERLTK